MQRRIFGIETEYGITCASTLKHQPPLNAEEAARELFNPVLHKMRSTNVYLPNGGRLYLDIGAHPEYATAECDTVTDLLAQIRAGEQKLANLADKVNKKLTKKGVDGKIHLFGNNRDSQGTSYGCHENYLLRRQRNFREIADALITFFVTRQIICGAGDTRIDRQGKSHYVISSRADQMHEPLSTATTQARPIINTRDEPLANPNRYRRLHVIAGDTNMAEPTTALKVASTDLVLAAIENGAQMADLALADPIKAIREISCDLVGQLKVELADGRKWTVAQIQKEIMWRIFDFVDVKCVPDLYGYLIDLWERAIDAVEKSDWSGIDTEIDFAIKHKLLTCYMERSGVEWSNVKVARLALSYHDITSDGILKRMEHAGLVKRLTTPEQVSEAQLIPPQTTRAKLRGDVVAAAFEAQREVGVDWVSLRLGGSGVVELDDPFAVEDIGVEAMMNVLRQK